MIQPRPLVPARDTCSRLTPYRLLERAPGMAFNFSSVLPHGTFLPHTEGDLLRKLPVKVTRARPGSLVYFPVQQSALAS